MAKKNQIVNPDQSNRMSVIAAVGGTSDLRKEISLVLSPGRIELSIHNFATAEKERTTLVTVDITNKQALMRFRAMLDVAIKTMS